MRTKCSKAEIHNYTFGLVCVDKVGAPVRHLFGKESFDPEETFDTLIACDQCLGLEDIPGHVAVNGQIMTLSEEIQDLKGMMKNISKDVERLNERVFGEDETPAAVAPVVPIKAPQTLSGSFVRSPVPLRHALHRHRQR